MSDSDQDSKSDYKEAVKSAKTHQDVAGELLSQAKEERAKADKHIEFLKTRLGARFICDGTAYAILSDESPSWVHKSDLLCVDRSVRTSD